MQTRSQTRLQTLLDPPFSKRLETRSQIRFQTLLEIDFDGASSAWRQNKISIGNGSFVYKKEPKVEKKETIESTTKGRYNLRKRKI
jgi:hypothetical protein